MKPRTTKPSNNKFYITKSKGGYSTCIVGKPTDPTANVLANCFTGDTKIITRDGIARLDEIVDKEIFALSKDGKYRKAIGRYFGQQEIYELKLYNGTYKVTGNHRWLVKSYGKNGGLKEKTTTELIKSDYIPYNIINNVGIDENGIRNGFIYGDGSYYNEKRQSQANLCGYKKQYMKKFFENAQHISYQSNGTEVYYPYPKEYKQIPNINKSLSYLNGFLIGLIASDGCVDKKDGCVTISTVKKEDAVQIRNICAVLGHRTKISKELRDTNYKKQSLLYRIHIKKSTLKSDMFLNPQHKENFGSPKQINYTRVLSLKKLNIVEDVFCIQEPETNTMTLASGILTGQCVGYACGRFNEIIGSMKYPQLNCNAENFIERAKNLGLKISTVPTLGGIMVWKKGTLSNNDGVGHVAVVEEINGNTILTSESSYGGKAFYTVKRTNSNGRWGAGSSYIFRGCIINPAIKEEKPYTMYVNTTHEELNVRDRAWGGVVGSLKRGTKVTVLRKDGEWSILSAPIKGYVYTEYLSSKQPATIKNTVGQIKTLKEKCHLYSKSNLTGTEYTYLKDTKVQILKNISSTVDYIKVVKTGREAYINNKYFK